MSKFKHISEKDSIISLYQSGATYVEIVKTLWPKCTNVEKEAQNVRRLILHFLGLQPKRITPIYQQKEKIRSLLLCGKKPFEIAQIINIKYPTVVGFLHKEFPQFKFTYNHGNTHYFDVIDSPSKAYLVGFISADGCLTQMRNNKHCLTITVKDSDVAVLEFLKSEIGCENPILDIVRPSSYNSSKIIYHKRFQIMDENISKSLINLGITSRKSLTMSNIITNIPYEYRDAFIIGYFDGDGSISVQDKTKQKPDRPKAYPSYSLFVSFRGTIDFLTGICNHLEISTTHIHQYDKIATLSFASKKDVVRLFKCYENLQFYYKRKFDKFLLRIHHPSYDKYK